MNLPNTHLHPLPTRETPAIVRMVTREDVLWNRPVFKAPPLVVKLPPAPTLADLSSISLHELGS